MALVSALAFAPLAFAQPQATPQMPMATGTANASMPASNPMVGGAAMSAQRDIVDNAMRSQDHTTLVAAVKSAGLVNTLKGPGPFTVFAPTNEAFAALPAGTVDTLLQPANKQKLTQVLTYHVVPGRLDTQALMAQIQKGNGQAQLKTVEGDILTVRDSGSGLTVSDGQGNTAQVTIPDVYQSNGVILVVDKVLMPSAPAMAQR
jgi:uncharacterized surface protein with fasciclin (FAS1) repeats